MAQRRTPDRVADCDEAVRSTGWVFDNKTGDVSLQSFTSGGDDEVRRYLKIFGFAKAPRTNSRWSRSAAASGA